MKSFLGLIVGLLIALSFIILIFKFLPLGIALVILAGMCGAASFEVNNRLIELIFTVGAWLWPIGVIVTFVQNGIFLGIISIILGVVSYSFAKTRNKY